MRIVSAAVLLTFLGAAATGHAASFTTYGSLAGFQAATGATSATGALPWAGALGTFSGAQATTSIGSVSVSAPSWFFTNWTTVLPGGEIGVSNGAGSVGGFFNDGIDATFGAPVYSAGFDFYEPTLSTSLIDGCNGPCVSSRYEIRVLSGTTLLATLPWIPPKDQRTFFGVWSDTPFTKLEIRETFGTDDNEFYGQFYTGTVAAPVPEPAGWLLCAAGLLALSGARRRR